MPKRFSILFAVYAVLIPANCFSQTDVLTWHNDNLRTGRNLSETSLTPANVKSATFGKLFNLSVDGKVDAQPLYASAVPKAGGGTSNVLFVVTEHDSVYAFSADSGAAFWPTVSMLKAGESPSDSRGCGQVSPEIGITGTPVIDRGAGPHGTIYLVAMSKDANGKYHHRLHALDITTGAEQFGGPVEIQASYPGTGDNSSGGTVVFDPAQYKARPGLLIVNGIVYTSWSSHCDIRPYTGWLMGYDKLTLAQTSVLNFAPNGSEAAIWNAGAGPAADANGNIFISMANGTFDTALNAQGFPSKGDYGNAFVKVGLNAGKLTVSDYWTMDNTTAESNSDQDLGSGGILLLPDVVDSQGTTRHLGVGAGKDRNLYIVDRDNMGKFTAANNNNIYQELSLALGGGEFGTPAWFNGSVYVGSVGDSIRQFKVAAAKLGTSPFSTTSHTFPYPGTTPSISANGTSNAILWAAENTTPAVLHAYDANNLATELYNSSQAAGNRDQFGAGNKYIVPTIANGKVFVGTTNSVGVFGLLIQTQTITFGSLSSKVIGSQPFTVSATASSGLPVSFTSLTTSVCTVSGSTVTLVNTGQCTIQASQAGDSTYSAAPTVNQSFQVTAAAAPTVTITAPISNATISGKTVALTATASASSGLNITSVQFKVDGNAIPGGTSTTSPYHATLDTTTLTDGPHNITAVATDSSGNSAPSAAVPVKVLNSVAPAGTEFITAATFGAARNNYTGWVGMQFTVGTQNVTVNALGRIYITGNTGTHQVKLVNATSVDVPGASVSINMTGGTSNKFKYAALASPVTLTANTSYFLLSQETAGADQWYDVSQVAGTNVANVNGSAYNTYFGYTTTPPSNTSYVPVSFLYGAGASSNPPSVTVTSPAAGTVSGSVTFSASATAASGLQITNLQLKVDGNDVGSPNTAAGPASTVSATLNTTTLANGAHTLTAVATDSSNTSGASAAVIINVSNATPPPSPAFITGQAPGASRNNFTGLVGMQFTTGSSALAVTSLGRMCVSSNTGTHLLKLVQANGSDLNGGSANVSMSGCTPGQYQYAGLNATIALTPNTTYYLLSQETSNGDMWFDYGPVTVVAGAGTVNGPAYYFGSYVTEGFPSDAYGPVNFHYTTSSTVPPSVTITSPAAGSVFGTITLTAQVSAGSNSVASVQFKLNGSNIGTAMTSPPYSTTLDTTTLTNGTTYQLTAVATDTLNNGTASPQVAITISNSGGGSASPLITAQLPGAARNFFTGSLGMQFTTGSSALTVSSLGRFCLAGNSATHVVKLVTALGNDIAGGSVTVGMAGCAPGTYKYQALAAPVVLAANTIYFLVSQETNGGDQWSDFGPVTSTSAATVNGPVYFSGFGYYGTGSPGSAYIPVNLLYK